MNHLAKNNYVKKERELFHVDLIGFCNALPRKLQSPEKM